MVADAIAMCVYIFWSW